MSSFLFTTMIGNLTLSVVLAAAAWGVQRSGRSPVLAHALWIMVLVKLLTPPVISLPLLKAASPVVETTDLTITPLASDTVDETYSDGASDILSGESLFASIADSAWLIQLLVQAWLVGSLALLGISLFRILQFDRILKSLSRPAPQAMTASAADVAGRLGLTRVPAVRIVASEISPMVWCPAGQPTVYIPESLSESLNDNEIRWILGHEFGHIRRRDHLVRWLEWASCVVFWWNPVSWWARRQLRINEEVCCDALVLQALGQEPRQYAGALMKVVEFLARPAIRPPSVASALTSGGFLEERFKMILDNKPFGASSTTVRLLVVLLALIVLPMGISYAQEDKKNDPKAKYAAMEKRIKAAIAAGEISPADGKKRLMAYRARLGEEARRKGAEGRRGDARKKYAAAKERIEAAVAAGKITEEAGRNRLMALRKKLAAGAARKEPKGQQEEQKRAQARYEQSLRKIKQAVEEGRLSEADAKKKYEELRRRDAGSKDRDMQRRRRERYMVAAEKIKAAVESGKLTEEEAEKKYAELKKRVAEAGARSGDDDERRRRGLRMRYRKALDGIKKAVESGEITEEEAQKKLAEMKKRMAEERGRRESEEKRRRSGAMDPELRKELMEIRKAVSAGKLSTEEARKKAAYLRKQYEEKK